MTQVLFDNPDIGAFYNSNIAPHFDAARRAIVINRAAAQTHIVRIAEEILSAHTLFPNAAKDIRSLEQMQAALLEQCTVSGEEVRPRFISDMPPVGIPAKGMNCWANALIQLIANVPALRASKLLTSFFENYRQAQLQERSSDIDGQVLRSLSSSISQSRWAQEDPVIALEEIIDRADLHYTFSQEIHHLDSEGKTVLVDKTKSLRKEPLIQLDLMKGILSFPALLKDFFSTTNDQQGQHLKIKFHGAPHDLFIQAKRFGYEDRTSFKINNDLENVPLQFDLDAQYNLQQQDAHYELTGCIIHTGKNYSGGHYIALVKKSSGWFLVNDSTVTPLSERAAESYAKQGYIFHYRRNDDYVPPSRCQEWKRTMLSGASTVAHGIFNFTIRPIGALISYLMPSKK